MHVLAVDDTLTDKLEVIIPW